MTYFHLMEQTLVQSNLLNELTLLPSYCTEHHYNLPKIVRKSYELI